MPGQTFESLEAQAAAVQNASNMRATLTGKGKKTWTMGSLMLPRLRGQWGQSGAGHIIETALISRGVCVFIPTQNADAVHVNGHRFDSQTLRLQVPREEFCISSSDWHCWFSLFIPDEVLAHWNANETNSIGSSSKFIQLSAERAEEFRQAIAQLGLIVHHTPGAFETSAAVEATTRKLAELAHKALGGNAVAIPKLGRHSVSRGQIVHAAMDFVDQHDCEYLLVRDLATAAKISERTLRAAFQEYFGFGPVQYLRLRMLNQVRKALQNADAAVTTVTQIATQFGVWELGRFAQDYRLLFDEYPSVTLRQGH